jgi:thioredoxin-dependent peroxiredoxin
MFNNVKRRFTMKVAMSVAAILALAASISVAADLKVGDKAPEFTLKGSDGKDYSLSQFSGKQAVVVAWFPKAFTRGCTAECKNMKESGEQIRKYNVAYFTASVDTPEQNAAFAKSLDLDFPILSDPTKETAKAYGVFEPNRGVALRWTYYIGADGVIKAIEKDVNTSQAAAQIAEQLQELGVDKN